MENNDEIMLNTLANKTLNLTTALSAKEIEQQYKHNLMIAKLHYPEEDNYSFKPKKYTKAQCATLPNKNGLPDLIPYVNGGYAMWKYNEKKSPKDLINDPNALSLITNTHYYSDKEETTLISTEFNPNSTQLVSCLYNKLHYHSTVALWNTTDLKNIQCILSKSYKNNILGAYFINNGEKIIVIPKADQSLILLDSLTGKSINNYRRNLTRKKDAPVFIWSDKHALIIRGFGNKIKFFSSENGNSLGSLQCKSVLIEMGLTADENKIVFIIKNEKNEHKAYTLELFNAVDLDNFNFITNQANPKQLSQILSMKNYTYCAEFRNTKNLRIYLQKQLAGEQALARTNIRYLKEALFRAIDAKNINECIKLLTEKTLHDTIIDNCYNLLYKIVTSNNSTLDRLNLCQLLFATNVRSLLLYEQETIIFNYILQEGAEELITFFLERNFCLPKEWKTLITPHSFSSQFTIMLKKTHATQFCNQCFQHTDELSCGIYHFPDEFGRKCTNCANKKALKVLEGIGII